MIPKNIFKTAITILVISNHDSFRVLFDEIASVYVYMENIFTFQHWKWPAQGTSTVPIVSAHFRSLLLGFCSFLVTLNSGL